jgi:hypothetical protein
MGIKEELGSSLLVDFWSGPFEASDCGPVRLAAPFERVMLLLGESVR